jgi:hypothetical protein
MELIKTEFNSVETMAWHLGVCLGTLNGAVARGAVRYSSGCHRRARGLAHRSGIMFAIVRHYTAREEIMGWVKQVTLRQYLIWLKNIPRCLPLIKDSIAVCARLFPKSQGESGCAHFL